MNGRIRVSNTTLYVAASLVVASTACNAIFSIDEGHFVPGAGGATGSGGIVENGGTAPVDAGKDAAFVDSGSGGTVGTGGVVGTGGTVATGGTTASGGRTGSGGTTALDAGSGGSAASVPGEVRCEGTPGCDIATGKVCCVANTTFDAHCSTSCDPSQQTEFKCDGPEDCPQGNIKICCVPFGQTTATCSASCATGGKVLCGKDDDCSPGQFCARGLGVYRAVGVCTDVPVKNDVWCGSAPCDTATGKVCCYSKTTKAEICTATCAGSAEIAIGCDGPEDCPVTAAVCCASHTGLGVFTGNHCAATCTAANTVQCGGAKACFPGNVCCRNGSSTTCSQMCAATTACSTSADCAGKTCDVIKDAALGSTPGVLVCQ